MDEIKLRIYKTNDVITGLWTNPDSRLAIAKASQLKKVRGARDNWVFERSDEHKIATRLANEYIEEFGNVLTTCIVHKAKGGWIKVQFFYTGDPIFKSEIASLATNGSEYLLDWSDEEIIYQ